MSLFAADAPATSARQLSTPPIPSAPQNAMVSKVRADEPRILATDCAIFDGMTAWAGPFQPSAPTRATERLEDQTTRRSPGLLPRLHGSCGERSGREFAGGRNFASYRGSSSAASLPSLPRKRTIRCPATRNCTGFLRISRARPAIVQTLAKSSNNRVLQTVLENGRQKDSHARFRKPHDRREARSRREAIGPQETIASLYASVVDA